MGNSLDAVLCPALPDLGDNGLRRVVWIHEVHIIAHSILQAFVPKAIHGRAAFWFNSGRSKTSSIAVERTSRYR